MTDTNRHNTLHLVPYIWLTIILSTPLQADFDSMEMEMEMDPGFDTMEMIEPEPMLPMEPVEPIEPEALIPVQPIEPPIQPPEATLPIEPIAPTPELPIEPAPPIPELPIEPEFPTPVLPIEPPEEILPPIIPPIGTLPPIIILPPPVWWLATPWDYWYPHDYPENHRQQGLLRLKVREEVKIRVTDSEQRTLFDKTLDDGEQRSLRGRAPFAVTLSDRSVVELFFNGQRVSLDEYPIGEPVYFQLPSNR